jgi:hypothetical protein
MDGECSMHVSDEKFMKSFSRKMQRPLLYLGIGKWILKWILKK